MAQILIGEVDGQGYLHVEIVGGNFHEFKLTLSLLGFIEHLKRRKAKITLNDGAINSIIAAGADYTRPQGEWLKMQKRVK